MIYINLKELRINAGLTQEAAAKMLDLEQSAISHWEQGNTFPLRKKWVHLARIYRCNVSDRLEITPELPRAPRSMALAVTCAAFSTVQSSGRFR